MILVDSTGICPSCLEFILVRKVPMPTESNLKNQKPQEKEFKGQAQTTDVRVFPLAGENADKYAIS